MLSDDFVKSIEKSVLYINIACSIIVEQKSLCVITILCPLLRYFVKDVMHINRLVVS